MEQNSSDTDRVIVCVYVCVEEEGQREAEIFYMKSVMS